jgi:hypothetical protein
LLAGWSNAVEFALMSAAARPTSDDGFAFGKEVLDRETNVGEGLAVKSHSLLLTLRASAEIARGTVVVMVARCEELVCYMHMAFVPNFSEQTTNVGFVLFTHVNLLFQKTRICDSPRASWGPKPLASGRVNLYVEQEVGPRARK